MSRINSNQYKKQNTAVAIAIGVLILVGVSFKVLFPTFLVDSGDKEHFFVREIGGKKYLEIKIKKGYPFHKLNLKLKIKKQKFNNFFGKIYQNELGLYPIKGKINSKEELDKFLFIKGSNHLKNGELIQKGNSVYFIENGMYRAFSNAETFDILGFDWSTVQKNKEEFLGDLEKGKNITLTTSYLPGSFVEIGEKLYLLGENFKYEINLNNKNLTKFIKDNFSVIEVDEKKLATLGKLNCHNKKSKIKCEFVGKEEKVLSRASILIEIFGRITTIDGSAKIHTFSKFNRMVPNITLRNVKERLIERYSKRFGINR